MTVSANNSARKRSPHVNRQRQIRQVRSRTRKQLEIKKGTNNDRVKIAAEDESKSRMKKSRLSRESTHSNHSKTKTQSTLHETDEEDDSNNNCSDEDQRIPTVSNNNYKISTRNSNRSSSTSSHSKRQYLEPEDIDLIYGDYVFNDEGSTSKNPFVVDSASDRTSGSSISNKKRRRTSEDTRSLPPKRSQRHKESKDGEVDEVDDDDDNVSEGKYEVKCILGHKVYRNKAVKYEIKWVGYSDKYNTWEPASSIHEDCPKICDEYWAKHEPRPTNVPTISTTTAPKQMQFSRTTNKQESYSERLAKKDITNKDLLASLRDQGFQIAYNTGFPTESTDWTLELRQIHLVQKVRGTDQILAYVTWANRKKTVHAVQELHEKCPDELINYYEARILFED